MYKIIILKGKEGYKNYMNRDKSISIMYMLLAAVFSATGQLMWKLSKNNFMLIFIGLFLYGSGSICMIQSFKKGKLSVVYPIMCSSYILAAIYGYMFLNEEITLKKVIAITIIIVGVIFCSNDK